MLRLSHFLPLITTYYLLGLMLSRAPCMLDAFGTSSTLLIRPYFHYVGCIGIQQSLKDVFLDR